MVWVLLALALLACTYFSFEMGGLAFLWEADVSKMSFLIIAVFVHSFIQLGRTLYRYYKGSKITDHELDPGFESCDATMAIGMLGTVIGFIIMTSSFVKVDFQGVESVKHLFALATTGISTALYTTAAGLVASILLRVCYYITSRLER